MLVLYSFPSQNVLSLQDEIDIYYDYYCCYYYILRPKMVYCMVAYGTTLTLVWCKHTSFQHFPN